MSNLVLTRRINETLIIGDDIKVTVLDVDGTQVKLSINAPKAVPVNRLEIYNKKYCGTYGDKDMRLLNKVMSRSSNIHYYDY